MASVRVKNPTVFKRQRKRVDAATQAAMDEVGGVIEGEIKDEITNRRDSRGFRGRTQSGATRRAVSARPTRRVAKGYRQVTEYLAPHGQVGAIIEKGRRPGKGVSRAGQRRLDRWARRKLGPVSAGEGKRFKSGGRAKAERARVFLIARKIKRRGIPGLYPFARVATSMRRGRAMKLYLAAFKRFIGGAI